MQSNPTIPVSIPRFVLLVNRYSIYPTLGIVTTLVATVVAIVLIPKDPFPAGALVNSATAMSIGLGFAPAVASLRNSQTILRAEHLLVLSPIYWLMMDLIQGSYALVDVNKENIEASFIAIGLFVCGIWVAVFHSPRSLPKALLQSASYKLNAKFLFRIVVLFFILGIMKFAYPCNFDPITMINGLFAERFSAPWARGATAGAQEAILDHLGYFGYLLPTLTIMLWLRSKRLSSQVVIAIVFSLIMAAFLAQGGGRRVIGVIFMAALICWIIEMPKLNIKHILIAIVTSTILLIGMQYMLEVRSVGIQNFSQSRETKLRVDDNFLRLAQIINIVPEKHPYIYEKQIVFVLIRPIPRALWPEKPLTSGFDLTIALGSGAKGMEGTSLTCSVIGEWYYSFGWIGVFVGGLIYGRLAGIASLILVKDTESANAIVYSLFAMALFVGMRAMVELVLNSYTILAWMGISRLFLGRQHLLQNKV